MTVGHALKVHDLLVIRTVVVHDAEERNTMMCRGPNGAGRIHEIAVILDAHAKASVLSVRKRRPDRGRKVGANTCSAASE